MLVPASIRLFAVFVNDFCNCDTISVKPGVEDDMPFIEDIIIISLIKSLIGDPVESLVFCDPCVATAPI
ncbi:hypothetical protein AA18889_2444 [Acetobacter senegalensis DSM 18889]|nr:hypothetical protein AA18889_2444 [Acetobacter senegalensis DSM 18889]